MSNDKKKDSKKVVKVAKKTESEKLYNILQKQKKDYTTCLFKKVDGVLVTIVAGRNDAMEMVKNDGYMDSPVKCK